MKIEIWSDVVCISGAQPAETFLQALRTAYAGEDAAAAR